MIESIYKNEIVVENLEDLVTWTVPTKANTNYLTHSYYRYIGKFPPQIAAKLLDDYYPGKGKILDPMVGGGTTLAEATLRGIANEGWDVNPVSRLISSCASRKVDPEKLESLASELLNELNKLHGDDLLAEPTIDWVKKGLKLKHCSEYFDDFAQEELELALYIINKFSELDQDVADLLMMSVLASLRKISYANVKKMNLELDLNKKNRSTLLKELSRRIPKLIKINKDLPEQFDSNLSVVKDRNAYNKWEDSKNKYGMIIMHPPYLTNTAFSEATQLQLAILGINHKSIWKNELRCRGSFLHEPNGLKKYLVNWAICIKSASQSLAKGGKLAVVVGDGQIDYVRIPVGKISEEFGKDAGLKLVDSIFHVLKNHTGQTQSQKMKGQHVIVFEK